MIRIRSFRWRIFAAILAVAMVPVMTGLVAGTLLLRGIGTGSGTLGPWTAVAESGGSLIDAALEAAPDDDAVARAAELHGEALTRSVQTSRLYAAVAERVVELLPWAALLGGAVLVGLAAWAAGSLSASFARPIDELVGWTVRIGEGEPLPAPEPRRGAREFEALRRALRDMAARLEAAREGELETARLKAWTEMSRRIAHELKNPLTPMRMSAAALARSDDPSTREAATILLDEVGRLDEMARTFAQFGRTPEGPPAPVDVVELLEGIVRRHDGSPTPVRLQVEGDVPLVVGHHDVLGRAFRNLIVNAQEAVGEAGGSGVDVSVKADADRAVVRVADDGPGIPPDLLERIWRPDVSTKRRGTGLGLALVDQAVRAHGGEATASNGERGGAVFVLSFPRGGAAAADAPEPATSARPQGEPWTS